MNREEHRWAFVPVGGSVILEVLIHDCGLAPQDVSAPGIVPVAFPPYVPPPSDLMDPSGGVNISIYAGTPATSLVPMVLAAVMARIFTGVYRFTYQTHAGDPLGPYLTTITANHGSAGVTSQFYGAFEVIKGGLEITGA